MQRLRLIHWGGMLANIFDLNTEWSSIPLCSLRSALRWARSAYWQSRSKRAERDPVPSF